MLFIKIGNPMDTQSIIDKIERIKLPIRILIFVGVLGVLFAVYFFLFYQPKMNEINTLNDKIEELENKIRIAKIKSKKIKRLEREHKEVMAKFQQALKLLPEKKEIPSLLTTISQLGKDSNLEFRIFKPMDEKTKTFYIEIPVSMEVTGTYHNVAMFFDKVGKMDRIVNILNVSMRPVENLSNVLNTKCDAITYRFKSGSVTKTATRKKKK